jgi:hypothetical protein
MQWMQIRRPLSALTYGLVASLLCFTAPNCLAVMQQPVKADAPTLDLPPITVSKRMLDHSPTIRHRAGNTVVANQHADVIRRPWSTHHNSAGRPVAINDHAGTHQKFAYRHRFSDPLPGVQHHSVRYIEPPEAFKQLPASTVLENQKLTQRFELAKVYQLAPFNSIVAHGDINITLRNTNVPQVAVLNQNQPGRDLVIATVKNGTLYLSETPMPSCTLVPRIRPLQVLVDANNIQMVRLYDKSSIYAGNYRTNRFNIVSASSGNVLLHSQMDVKLIEQHGSGMISIDWVKGNTLDIFTQGPGLIRLAGSVNTLNVRAIGNGKVDAKYLRTEDAVVQTGHNAEVAVRPHLTLNGFASQHSYIYYYKTPDFITPRTYGSGNIIQMRYWD